MNSKRNLKTITTTDQEKHNHREAIKGHKTRKHYLNAIREEEAEEEITECKSNDLRTP